jgi:hypothetical protein
MKNMAPVHRRLDDHSDHRGHSAVLTLLALLICGALLAGPAGASTPAYCQPLTKTEKAVKSLPTVKDVAKDGAGTLKSALAPLKQDATSAANQAKSAFSSQATALKKSVDALSSTVKQLSGSSLSVQKLAQLGTQLKDVGTAVKNLRSAVSSKCG